MYAFGQPDNERLEIHEQIYPQVPTRDRAHAYCFHRPAVSESRETKYSWPHKRYVDGGRMSVHRFLINRPFRVYPGVGEGLPLHCVNDHMDLHQVGVEG